MPAPDIDDGKVVGDIRADESSVEAPLVGQRDNRLARAASAMRHVG